MRVVSRCNFKTKVVLVQRSSNRWPGRWRWKPTGQPGLTNVYTTFRANVPQLFAEVDRTKAKTLDIPLSELFNTLQTYLGSSYVNDFNKFWTNVSGQSPSRTQVPGLSRRHSSGSKCATTAAK